VEEVVRRRCIESDSLEEEVWSRVALFAKTQYETSKLRNVMRREVGGQLGKQLASRVRIEVFDADRTRSEVRVSSEVSVSSGKRSGREAKRLSVRYACTESSSLDVRLIAKQSKAALRVLSVAQIGEHSQVHFHHKGLLALERALGLRLSLQDLVLFLISFRGTLYDDEHDISTAIFEEFETIDQQQQEEEVP